jgi:uncharacterized membrane protein
MSPRQRRPAPELGVVRGAGPAAPNRLADFDRDAARWSGGAALALGLGWAIVFATLCAGKLAAFLYDDFDLALFAQAIHGVLRGSFASSIRGMPWLADHSSFVLVPLAPLAAIVPAPLLLVTLQALALGLGAVVVHRIARRELGSPLAALALAAAWLLQPALAYVTLFEFHPETLAVPALLVAWNAWREGRSTRMTLAAGFALLCKEDVAFVVLGLALAALITRRRRGVADAVALAAPALAISAVTFLVLKPMARGLVDYGRLYAAWGPTPRAALEAMLLHPIRLLGSLVGTTGNPTDSTAKLVFWMQTLGPWAFAPLAGPIAWLPAAPVFAEHLLSDRIEQHVIVYQYTALVLPWLAAGTVAALAWLLRALRESPEWPGGTRAIAVAFPILVAAALAQWLWGPFTAVPHAMPVARPQRVFPDGFDRAMRPWRESLVRRIGAVDGVVSGFETLQRFHARANVVTAHHVLGGLYTFSEVPYPTPRDVHAALLDTSDGMLMDWIDSDTPEHWRALVQTNGLVPVEAHGDLLLWLAGARDTLALLTPGAVMAPLEHPISFEERVRLLGAALPSGPVPAGGELPIVTSWQRHGDLDGILELALALRPVDDPTVKRAVHSRFLGYGLWSVDDWPTDVVMRERYRWVLPDDLPAGDYDVEIALASKTDQGLHPYMTNLRPDPDGFFALGRVTVTRGRR